jgi:hypothetical protein
VKIFACKKIIFWIDTILILLRKEKCKYFCERRDPPVIPKYM